MITQKKNEPRYVYLIRVAAAFARQYPEGTIQYDETTCDGSCLANDLEAELDELEQFVEVYCE